MPTEPIRLIIDARYASDAFPGIGRVTSGLARALAVHPGIAALHLISNPASTATWAALPAASARVQHHHLSAAPRSAAEDQQVRALVHTVAVDWFFSPYLRLPPGSYSPRTLVMVHDAIPLHAPGIAWHVRIGYALALWDAARRATQLVTVSHTAAHAIAPWIWPQPAPAVVPNGVTRDWPDASAVDLSALGIHGPYALCVSSNQPHKHLDALINAWLQLRAADRLPPRATLVICGHMHPHRPQPWQGQCAGERPIVVLQDASDPLLHALYAHAQCVVQPSLAEGYGLPVLESLAHGTPVLVHDLPVYREYAPGLVDTVDTRDPAAFAAALQRLWHDTARATHIATAGPACAAAHTWMVAADALVAVMQKNPPVSDRRDRRTH